MTRQPNVREGDIVTLTCENVGSRGDGLFKNEGYVIFCPGTEVGKTYELRITKVKDNSGFAEVISQQ